MYYTEKKKGSKSEENSWKKKMECGFILENFQTQKKEKEMKFNPFQLVGCHII